jgi:hypothetical protein
MGKHYSWIEVYNPETGKIDKYRHPLDPDSFPEDEDKEPQKGRT